MKKVVIFGNEKMAELAYKYFTRDKAFEVVAFAVDEAFLKEPTYQGLPNVAFEKVTDLYPPTEFDMYVAVGYTKLNKLRAQKYQEAKDKGYKLVSYVCSKNIHWDEFTVGDNTFIFENQVIQPGVKFGNNVIIWSGNHFGHDVVIEDHAWVSSHCVLCGYVKVGQYSFLGVNCTIRDDITIAEENLIGAGALILTNTKPKEVYVAEATKKYPLDSAKFMMMAAISANKNLKKEGEASK